MGISRRIAMAAVVGAGLLASRPGWPEAPPAPWLPPDLTREERQEWKGARPPGWSRGEKRGWRGLDCPPGLAKKGRCGPRAAPQAPPGWDERLREAIERLKKWGREQMRLPAPVLEAVLIGVEGAVRHGVPVDAAERVVRQAAARGVSPYGIEAITRALAYGAARGARLDELESFTHQGLAAGAAEQAIALGIYRRAAEARR